MKTLYWNGQIITVDQDDSMAEAVLVIDGRIEAVGTNTELQKLADRETECIDLQGKTMLPGFIDSHGHIIRSEIYPRFCPPPVGEIDSVEKLIKAVQEEIAVHPPQDGCWFIGMGYDNAFFPGSKHPSLADMDQISTDIPVVLQHCSGHVGMVNSKVLSLLGITKETPDPPGGKIGKNPVTGELTGLLEEKAILNLYQIEGIMPQPSLETLADAFLKAQQIFAANGVTTAQDGATSPVDLPIIQYCQERDMMLIDLYAYPLLDSLVAGALTGCDCRQQPHYDRHFRIAGAKMLLDGSPQGKTAWLSHPYHEPPEGKPADYCGYPIYEDETVVCDMLQKCLQNHWQILVHCNGDAASQQFIDMYAKAQEKTGMVEDLRPVMIHAQTVREDQLDRMRQLGIMPSFFHDHTYYWGDYHLDSVLGAERGRRISPVRSALNRGMNYTLHVDYPVVPQKPLFSIHNAVNRQTRQGRAIGPEFTIGVMDAIRAVTIYGAYQCFEEKEKGSIEPGKYADLVILSQNPLQTEKSAIKDIQVLETIKAGRTIYRA